MMRCFQILSLAGAAYGGSSTDPTCLTNKFVYKENKCCGDPEKVTDIGSTCGALKAEYKAHACCPGKRTNSLFVEQLGMVHAVCDTTGPNPEIYLEMDKAGWFNISSDTAEFDFYIDIPAGCPPYKHVFVSAATTGHPAWDMAAFAGERNGGYGVLHYDIHFFTISAEERVAVTVCDVNLGTYQCDQTVDNDMLTRFNNMPPLEYMAGFFEDTGFGGHAVVGHGNHLIAETDRYLVSNCGGGSGTGDWVDCQNQFLSAYPISVATCGTPGCAFVDLGCRCPYWDDMTTPILNTYDGRVVANEIMPAQQHVAMLGAELSNPYLEAYPQAAKYIDSGFHPLQTRSYVSPEGTVQMGLTLSSNFYTADSEM